MSYGDRRHGGGGGGSYHYGSRSYYEDDDAGGFGGRSSGSGGRSGRESGRSGGQRGYEDDRYSYGRDSRSSRGGTGSGFGYGSREAGHHSGGSRAPPGRGGGRDYRDGGGYGQYEPERREADLELEYQQRVQAAYRRMEESSANSVRTLHETLNTGIDAAEELDRQAETMDRIEARLDHMDGDLDQSRRHMRNIKSIFGGIGNAFARRRDVKAVTDPKVPASAPSSGSKSGRGGGTSPTPPPDKRVGASGRGASTGSKVVDQNMDEMERVLYQLKGVGELMSEQLDDSDGQIDRVRYKLDRNNVKVKNLNKDIQRQL